MDDYTLGNFEQQVGYLLFTPTKVSNKLTSSCRIWIQMTSHFAIASMLRQEMISISKLKYMLNYIIKIKKNCYKMKERTKTKELYCKIETSSFIFTFFNYINNLK